ncbi:MAG: CpaF family protein [Candidatus Nucleicultricaceae bacterium]
MLFGRRDKQGPSDPQRDDSNDTGSVTTERHEKTPKKYTLGDHSELSSELNDARNKIFDELLKQMDLRKVMQTSSDVLLSEIEQFVARYAEEQHILIGYSDQRRLAADIVNDMIGLGPLEQLMNDQSISDIMINGPNTVYVERRGHIEKTNVKFRSNQHLLQIAQRIAGHAGRRVDESSPLLDTRLRDGSRVNVVIPPVALDGVSVSIRRFSDKGITFDDMVKSGSISKQIYDFLAVISKCRMNVIVSGGTGSGKTTMLNALSQLIDPGERIVTIEDSAELRLKQPHVVRLESRPANVEGQGRITIRDLVQNALRMRPDRIIVGECRGGETFDMLQAMNTGHDGSMSTIHANNAEEALHRLENMVLMSGFELPTSVIKGYIAGAVEIIIQTARMRDGVRRISEIVEITGYNGNAITTKPLFRFIPAGTDAEDKIAGEFKFSGQMPTLIEKIDYLGFGDELRRALE